MAKRLVSVRRVIEDAEDEGQDPSQLFINPDDIVELEEDDEDEE